MAYTQNDLVAIQRAIASGRLEVSMGGRQVKYRTVRELERAYEIIKADLASQNGPRSRLFRIFHAGKGWG